MNRRQFLTIGAVGLVSSQAGCLGYTVQDQEEVDERKNRIENLQESLESAQTNISEQESQIVDLEEQRNGLQNEISEKESQIADLEEQINNLNSDLQSAEENIASLEEDKQRLEAEIILDLYSWAISMNNDGLDYWSGGIELWNNENYTEARAEFNVAAGYFDSAFMNMKGAGDRADEFGYNQTEDLIRETQNKVNLRYLASGQYQLASRSAARGEYSDAQSYQDTGEQRLSEAENYEFYDLNVLEDELGVSLDI